MIRKIKAWAKENGIVGWGALLVAAIAGWHSLWFVMWGSIGFWAGKNWEIIVKLWNESYRDKVNDAIEDAVDKAKDTFKRD